MTTKVCEKCGKEFEARGDWQKICIDCYKASAPAKTSTKATTKATTQATSAKATITAEDLRKAYDEVTAVFADVKDEVKDYLGGWTTTIALSSKR